jgi:hypothetical protein
MNRTLLTVLAVSLAAPVSAQTPTTPPPGRAEMHLGPVTLRPRLEIREAGFDSNIFNEAEDPREDFTASITPRLDTRLDVDWARATYATYADFVYFHEFTDERSINAGNEGRFELVLDRVRPYVSGAILSTRDRLNAEVDARASRREWRAETGAAIALTTRTQLVVAARRGSLEFDEDEIFDDVALATTLNNDYTAYEAGVRVELTPLTTLQIMGAYQLDRFDTASARDSRTWRLSPTLHFDPSALISGLLTVGYINFEPESPALEPYRGLVATGTLKWSVDTTRIEGTLERDVRYSYELENPYYVITGGRVTFTQRIAGPLDGQVVGGRQRLAYQELAGVEGDFRGTDTITTWGGGIGFRLGETARLGLNYEDAARRSPRPERNFDRQRIYGSLAYGF